MAKNIDYYVGNQNDWRLSFKGQKLVVGKFQHKEECFIRVIDTSPCAAVKRHDFVLQFQMTADYSYSKVDEKTADLQFFRNNAKWNRILISAENLEKMDSSFLAASTFENKRIKNYLKNGIKASSTNPEYAEIIPSANLVFAPTQKLKSFCMCFILTHYYLKGLTLKFLGNSPMFSFTNFQYCSNFVALKEIQLVSQNFFHKSFVQFLIALKSVKNLNTLKLEGRHESLDPLFVNFPLQVKKLMLKKFNTKIPPSIENAVNLEELALDSINGKLRPEIFALKNFQALTLLRRQYIRYLPSTAMHCKITNLSFLSYYIPTITFNKPKETLTLFETAAAHVFTHRPYHSVQMAPQIVKRLRSIRSNYRMCSKCLKIFNKKLFCVKKMEKRGHQWFRHIFCQSCYEKMGESNGETMMDDQ